VARAQRVSQPGHQLRREHRQDADEPVPDRPAHRPHGGAAQRRRVAVHRRRGNARAVAAARAGGARGRRPGRRRAHALSRGGVPAAVLAAERDGRPRRGRGSDLPADDQPRGRARAGARRAARSRRRGGRDRAARCRRKAPPARPLRGRRLAAAEGRRRGHRQDRGRDRVVRQGVDAQGGAGRRPGGLRRWPPHGYRRRPVRGARRAARRRRGAHAGAARHRATGQRGRRRCGGDPIRCRMVRVCATRPPAGVSAVNRAARRDGWARVVGVSPARARARAGAGVARGRRASRTGCAARPGV